MLDIHTQHWIGRAPSGRLEDFHAVRIVSTAICPRPTDPVVYDVGGLDRRRALGRPGRARAGTASPARSPRISEAWLRPWPGGARSL